MNAEENPLLFQQLFLFINPKENLSILFYIFILKVYD